MADASKAITGTELLKTLELRLDNVVYTLGFANSRREARQLIGHNHFLVNGKRVNIASALVKKGDVIEVAEKSKELATILSAIQAVTRRSVPAWLDANHAGFKGIIKDAPTRDEITISVEESMIVEYYSR